jgi:hypothetical protein
MQPSWLVEHDASALPVLDGDGHVIAILSEADLIKQTFSKALNIQTFEHSDFTEGRPSPFTRIHHLTTCTSDARQDIEFFTKVIGQCLWRGYYAARKPHSRPGLCAALALVCCS